MVQRLAIGYIARRERKLGPITAEVDAHQLDAAEQRTLVRVQWILVVKATLLGAASGLVAALAELWADANLAPQPDAGMGGYVRYWAFLGGVVTVASLAEVLVLYLESLKAVHSIARTAGTKLFVDADEAEPHSPMSAALVRAALELPNPPPQSYAIDPLREVSRLRAIAVGLLYKAKIGLTSFLIKLVLRRAASRAALRAWLVFVGVPVTAFWNGLVAFIVIREARLRAIGPSAARRFCDLLDFDSGEQRAERSDLIWRAVAATVVRTHDLHPNVRAFMDLLREDIGDPPDDRLDDTTLFLEKLAAAPIGDQRQAIRALVVAAVLDGKISGDERKLLDDAATATGLAIPREVVTQLRAAFVGGKPLDASSLLLVAP